MTEAPYKLKDLADAAGVTPRTVRYYIAQGLLASPGRLGANTRYGREHLERLRLIRRLQDQGLPLAAIWGRLKQEPSLMSAPMMAEAPPPMFTPMLHRAFPARSGPDLASASVGRTSWERIVLAPDLELHVQRPSDAETTRLVDEILALTGRTD